MRGSRRVKLLVSASSKSWRRTLTRFGRPVAPRDSLEEKGERPNRGALRRPTPRHPRHQEKITTGQPIRSGQALAAMARARGGHSETVRLSPCERMDDDQP